MYSLSIPTIPAKTIVTKNKTTAWFGSDYTMNIYKGCSHGCIYCDSRSACYHVENFDTVRVKENALEIIENELRRKVKTGVIGTGSMSDPYNPYEKKLELTREALKLICIYGFGVAIATKSDLITRDIDLLKKIQTFAPVISKITITTSNDAVAKKIEPYVSPSSKRFEAIGKLSEAGIFTGVLMMPILPFIEDTGENIYEIVNRAADCGAKFIYPALGMTMRLGQREYFYAQLDKHYPGLSEKYMSAYSNNYQCSSPQAKKLWKIFSSECKRHGILYEMPAIIRAYQKGYTHTQLSLF